MRSNSRNNNKEISSIVGHLTAEKKKTVMAFCLIALMGFMWIKVFTGKNSSTANAEQMKNLTENNSQSDTQSKVSYVDLPEIEGRNDVITRDFFSSNGWKNFVDTDRNVVVTKEVNVVPGDGTEKVIRKIADNLKLEAFVMGDNPRAYINDKILSVGDKLLVSDGNEKYECEVITIENNSVVMRCGKAEVTLKLKQIIEDNKQSQ